MATLPLYTPVPPTADAGASRRVVAPGGFEVWHAHAHGRGGDDGQSSVTVVADFYAGYPFHADYLAAYARYRRRPTRVAPPAPRDFACVSVAVYEADRPAAAFLCHADSGQFEASDERLDVRLAGNALVRQPDGSIRLTAAAASTGVAVDLVFCPRIKCRVVHRTFAGLGPNGVQYHWSAGEPLFDVAGDVRLDPARALRLEGVGYHDYVFTTGPLAPGIRRWSRSRALFDDRALVVHHAIPVRRALPVMALAAEGSAGGWVEPGAGDGQTGAAVTADRSTSLLPLGLTPPDVDHRAGPVRRMIYDVRLNDRVGRALCETSYPSRLHRPLLGRWTTPRVPPCRMH